MGRLKPSRHQTSNLPTKKFLTPSSSKPEKNLQTLSPKQTQKSKQDLKQQIQALGGDEDDYKLVENADSDSSDVERIEGKGKVQSSQTDVGYSALYCSLM